MMMMMKAKIGVIALLACSTTMVLAASDVCKYAPDGTGVTYDLSQLQLHGYDYTIAGGDLECTANIVEKNYTYTFNFCSNVNKVSRCRGNGAVIQEDVLGDGSCKVAGRFNAADKSMFDFVDPNRKAAGVSMRYAGGDRCHTNNVDRTTTIKAMCDERATSFRAEKVAEPGGVKSCQYEITIFSVYACPTECPISDGMACAGNGHCRYDRSNSKARCYCNTGFGGDDCSVDTAAKGSFDGTLTGLLVTVLVIVLILAGALVMLLRQVRGFRNDASNYIQIQGQELIGNDSI